MLHAPAESLVTVESFENASDAPEIGALVTASLTVPASVHVFAVGVGDGVTPGGAAVGLDGVPPQPITAVTAIAAVKYKYVRLVMEPLAVGERRIVEWTG
jgi:hypothetical protein